MNMFSKAKQENVVFLLFFSNINFFFSDGNQMGDKYVGQIGFRGDVSRDTDEWLEAIQNWDQQKKSFDICKTHKFGTNLKSRDYQQVSLSDFDQQKTRDAGS